MPVAIAATSANSPGLSPIQRANERVLSVLRQPSASGLAIISLELPPRLLAAGLRPGDIISHADGSPVRTKHDLRHLTSVVKKIGEKKIPILVARGEKLIHLHIAPQPLHVAVVPVVAGTAAPLGPLATPPGQYRWHWNQVPTLQPVRGRVLGHNSWYLLLRHGEVTGALHLTISRHNTHWLLHWNCQAIRHTGLTPARWTIHFTTANGPFAVPLRLKTLIWREKRRSVRAIPEGNTLALTVRTLNRTQLVNLATTRQMLVPMPAIALLAAALPHRTGVVASLAELSASSLATRLNCSLRSMGQGHLRMDGVTVKGWRVDLLRFATVQETFFFASDGTLLAINGPHGIQALHVASHAVVRHVIPKKLLESLSARKPHGSYTQRGY